MIASSFQWIQAHTSLLIEILGVLTAVIYLFFSIRQKIWLWPFGILTSVFYLYIFFSSRLYADMALQVYYLLISFYGWYFWLYGGGQKGIDKLKVTRLDRNLSVRLLLATILIYVMIVLALLKIPGLLDIPSSDIPYWDAFTTAASIIATWMLARKIIEHWLVWILVDSLSVGLYIYKELYLTSALFFVYAILAIIGYREWKKHFRISSEENPGS